MSSGSEGSDSHYEDAPVGLVTIDRRGSILRANRTFLTWTNLADHHDLPNFHSMLRTGDRIFWETHVSPLLDMHGEVREIAAELAIAGSPLPVLINARVSRVGDPDATIDLALFSAAQRRMYEKELLEASQRAEASESLARSLAKTLQRSLMPPNLPTIEGFQLGAAYRPAGAGDEVGGDFYDVFQTSASSWMVALGDVRGKGASAASLTGLVRYAIRGAAMQVKMPSEILRTVNAALLLDGSGETCTVALMAIQVGIDPVVTIALAGHPRPRRVGIAGGVTPAGIPGTLLGAFEDVALSDESLELKVGETLVLFTDGVPEARSGDDFYGEERLDALLEGMNDASPAEIASAISSSVVAYQQGRARDDVAMVAVRRSA